MASPNLSRILSRVLTLSLAAPLGGLFATGCGGIDTEGFQAVACGQPGNQYLSGFKPGKAADYIELREIDVNAPSTVLESSGEKCKNASDKAACEAAIAAVMPANSFDLGDCGGGAFCLKHFLVAQTGDTVEVFGTKDEAAGFLAPIDTPTEAVFLASAAGYTVQCADSEEGGVRAAGSGYEVLGTKTTSSCTPFEVSLFKVSVAQDGAVAQLETEVIRSDSNACAGRRPAGLEKQSGRGTTELGAYLGSVAHLEAASIFAFEALAEELAHYGAPAELIQRALLAREDEVRHAKVMKKLAARHGGEMPSPRVEKRALRTLEEIALDNAVEGCIRETYGALIGMWQARFSRDPALRRAMRSVAADEMRHAELSWAIHAWIQDKIAPDARAWIQEAQEEALREIEMEALRGNTPELVALGGLPDSEAGARLAEHFKAAVQTLSSELN